MRGGVQAWIQPTAVENHAKYIMFVKYLVFLLHVEQGVLQPSEPYLDNPNSVLQYPRGC